MARRNSLTLPNLCGCGTCRVCLKFKKFNYDKLWRRKREQKRMSKIDKIMGGPFIPIVSQTYIFIEWAKRLPSGMILVRKG